MAKGRVAAFLVAAGSVAGALLWKRRSGAGKEHVDVYFADGSVVNFDESSAEAARLLPVARRILTRTRG
ncbi:MAG TPA: hypothetical protein VK915_07105 [Gaiellaceae bacterium]|nr:hypothetical protein [Gaiellaceae bacterium]